MIKPQADQLYKDNTPLLLCCYDIESTGLSTQYDDIIQFAVHYLQYQSGETICLHTYNTFVHTTKSIPNIVTQLTKITQSDVESAPTIEKTLMTVQSQVNDLLEKFELKHIVWVAHNGNQFDHKMLQRVCQQHEKSTLLQESESKTIWFADTLHMSRSILSACPLAPENHKLGTLYAWCLKQNNTTETTHALSFHNADDDVLAMRKVMETMLQHQADGLHQTMVLQQDLHMKRQSHHKQSKDKALHTKISPHTHAIVQQLLSFRDD
ncbi:MAG TPA: hypothetical protein EYO58_12870, partial [Flavobacteriales bacterium]|nr:hypothetical protein [Flavobacteriales bacterium]